MQTEGSGFAGGQIGTEYEQLLLAIPHYQEVQNQVGKRLANHIKGKPSSILEIGCGTGLTTCALLEAVPLASVVAIDKYATMLDQARNAFEEHPRVMFVESDALEYLRQLGDGVFDAVVTVFCLHNEHPDYRKEAFREIGRVTKYGGIIISADKIAQDDVRRHEESLHEQLKALEVFRGTPHWELEREWTEHYLEDDQIRMTEAEQVMLLTEAKCHEIKRHGRWRMEALYTGVRCRNFLHT